MRSKTSFDICNVRQNMENWLHQRDLSTSKNVSHGAPRIPIRQYKLSSLFADKQTSKNLCRKTVF
jgi:hypothetical protein